MILNIQNNNLDLAEDILEQFNHAASTPILFPDVDFDENNILNICRSLVDLCEGEMIVGNIAGQGAIATITLPIHYDFPNV